VLAFTLRRFLVTIPVLVLSSILVFLLVATVGDPLDEKRQNPHFPRATLALLEQKLHLTDSLVNRYVRWLTGILHGNFGYSDRYKERVGEELFHRMFVTLRMVVVAMIVAAILALVVGIYTSVKQYSAGDFAATFASFLFLSMPTFWLAVLLKQILAIKLNEAVGRRLVSTIGDRSTDPPGDFLGRIGDYAGHLLLPTITLALVSYASWSRFQRASMLEVLNSDYVRLARAKGLSRARVLIRHAVRTALIPFTTVVALDVAAILGGAIITERVFQWHGMGEFGLQGILDKDPNVTLAWLMLTGVIVVAFNLVADLLYAVLDPRIRFA
jgi:peptide/nickel transport system permease protein